MSAEDVHVSSRSHVPYTRYAIASTGDQHVQRRMQGQGVNSAEMSVVVADDLVGLCRLC
jgi:hypothetical protein